MKNIPSISTAEDSVEAAVEPFMKTKCLLGLVAILAVTGFTASAQAGWSVGVSIAAPVRYAPQVVVAAPVYAPPVAYCPSPVVYCPPPVIYCPPRVVYVEPRYKRQYDYRNYRGHDRDDRGRGHDDRGRDYSGHR